MPGKRIVLLEMSTEDAEEFVRAMSNENVHPDTLGAWVISATVQAVVARPTSWCKCDVPQESRYQRRRRQAKRESAWHRGATFGWWTCTQCNKPSRAIVKHYISNMLAGANDLLPKILGTGPAQSPQDRWRTETGEENPHVNANPDKGVLNAGPSRRSQRRKPSRSERDRVARASS